MKLITELNEQTSMISEDIDGEKQYFIEGVFLQGNLKNRNGRYYDVSILEREVNKYVSTYVKKNRAFGELGHPDGPTINLDRVSHMIVELKREGNNFMGKAKIIADNPMGKIAANFIKEGATLGVSSRGMGSLKPSAKGYQVVQSDFHLATAADIVADPSAPDAFVNGIMEGVEWIWDNGVLKAQQLEEIVEDIEYSARTRQLDESAKLAAFDKFLKSFGS